MTNCFCCASNVLKQPDYYNNLCTAVKFTLKLRKEREILRCLLRELGSTSDVENSIKNIVYCSVQVVSIQKYFKKLNYFLLEAGDEFKCQKRQFHGTFNLYNHDI